MYNLLTYRHLLCNFKTQVNVDRSRRRSRRTTVKKEVRKKRAETERSRRRDHSISCHLEIVVVHVKDIWPILVAACRWGAKALF